MSKILRFGKEDKQPMSSPQLNVEFEVGRTLTLRPSQVVRGMRVTNTFFSYNYDKKFIQMFIKIFYNQIIKF
jgi:hypothetical protein